MVNIDPVGAAQQPMSDDQELAKVLAGVDQQGDEAAAAGAGSIADDAAATLPEPAAEPEVVAEPVVPPVVEPPVLDTPAPVASTGDDLGSVKTQAISELRPLVDKLNVPAEEKFDTYLLLLRSTDDKSLIEPAHETAKLIEDEARRAQALLDIIKEIDFLSQNGQ